MHELEEIAKDTKPAVFLSDVIAEDTKEQERRKKYYEDHTKELIKLMQQTKEQS